MDAFLHRSPQKVKGFPDDFQNTFEDLIDCFTPYDNILKILEIEYGVLERDLNFFCQIVYNRQARDAYQYLFYKADMYARKAVTNLAKDGNKTALSCMIDHFAKWSEGEKNNSLTIHIDGGIPKEDK